MTATPDYSDEKAVRLTYARNEVPFEDLATNENSRELARSIEEPKASPTAQTPPNTANAAVSALLASTTETASQAIDQLDGSKNANLAKATLNSDSPISATMLSAMRQLDSASSYSNSSGAMHLAWPPAAKTMAESGCKRWVTAEHWIATTTP